MIHYGDLFDVLPTLPDASIDACVTDPPYGIGFMGREWDTFKPEQAAKKQGLRQINKSEHYTRKAKRLINPNLKGRTVDGAISSSQIEYDYTATGLRAFQEWTERWAREVHRVMKPGAYIVVCGAPRSYHRMACGLEDAGFVVRDQFAWLFGSGFPKNFNLGDGKGTALKPAHEPIALAWKPFKGTIKACHEAHGTAALNIDACRVGDDASRGDRYNGKTPGGGESVFAANRQEQPWETPVGRWPANVVLDDEAAAALDEQTGELSSGELHSRYGDTPSTGEVYGAYKQRSNAQHADRGGASRFYYVAKPSREERDFGCDALELKTAAEITGRKPGSAGLNNPRSGIRAGSEHRDDKARIARNIHPTVKPVELMRWLVKLVTPIGGTVLDPFTGSGTTGMACRYEQREFIGIEREADYVQIAERRIAAVAPLFAEPMSAGAVDPQEGLTPVGPRAENRR